MILRAALTKIQKDLHVPKLRNNTFGGYKYRNAEDIESAVKKILPEDVALVISDEVVCKGDRYYIKATSSLVADSGETISATGWAREAENKKGMDSAQLTGATSSYARKYALCGLFCIDDGIDSDNDGVQKASSNGAAPAKQAPSSKVSEKQLKRLWAISNKHKVQPNDLKQMVTSRGFESSKDLTREAYDSIISEIEGGK